MVSDGASNVWGSAYADTLTGNSSANLLQGNGGNDTLTGGNGSDTYQIGRGDGVDSIVQSDITDASTTTDVVKFSTGVSYDQLWFSQSGDDLTIAVIGEASSRVLLKDWYNVTSRQVDSIPTPEGRQSRAAAPGLSTDGEKT